MMTIKAAHEDIISKVKEFIQELSHVQDDYYKSLVKDLGITSKGEDWLVDYIYNSDDSYVSFQDYCNAYKVKDDIFNTKTDTPITDNAKRKIVGYADEWVPRYVSEEIERKLNEAQFNTHNRDECAEEALRDIALFLSCGGYNDVGLVEFDAAKYAKKIKEAIVENTRIAMEHAKEKQ
jgi:hypothetical protein